MYMEQQAVQPTPKEKQPRTSAELLNEKRLQFIMPLEGLRRTPNREIFVITKDGKNYTLSLEGDRVVVKSSEGLSGTLDEVYCDGIGEGNTFEFAVGEGGENLKTAAIVEMIERDTTS